MPLKKPTGNNHVTNMAVEQVLVIAIGVLNQSTFSLKHNRNPVLVFFLNVVTPLINL